MTATIEFLPHSTHRTMTIDVFLSSLVKQGQLDKIKVGPGGVPKPTQGIFEAVACLTLLPNKFLYQQVKGLEVVTGMKKGLPTSGGGEHAHTPKLANVL